MKKTLGLALVLSAAGLCASAQDGPREKPRDEVFKMVDAYVVSNLQESLGLKEEQFQKMLPLVRKLQTDRRSLGERRMRAMRDLKQTLESGGASEARIVDLLKEAKAAEAEFTSTMQKDVEAIDAALTPVQQAKFRILEFEVERKIRQLVNGMRPDRPGAGRRRQD